MTNVTTALKLTPPEAEVIPLRSNTPRSENAYPEQSHRRESTRIPHISIQAFCHSPNLIEVVRSAAADRLMSRSHVVIEEGGISAAVEKYQQELTPQLIVIESQLSPETFLADLDRLAEVCDTNTKVVVIGHVNDVSFYRELTKRGVSDYLLAPIDPLTLITAIAAIYGQSASVKLGQSLAFVGAKGGVGSSTVAHNVGWMIARQAASEVVLADMDLAFGTASLDFNLDPGQGVVEAIEDKGRLDEVLFERLLAKCGDHLSLLRAPGSLDRCYDLSDHAVDALFEVAQSSVPYLILDMPHVWSTWAKNALVSADEIIITAVPDLPNLRNAKNLISFLKQARPHDPPPKLVLNQVGVPKKPEIKPVDFAKAVQLELLACIPFEPSLFGKASNEGKMTAELSARAQGSKAFAEIADVIAVQRPRRRSSPFSLGAVIKRMGLGSRSE